MHKNGTKFVFVNRSLTNHWIQEHIYIERAQTFTNAKISNKSDPGY